MQASFPASSEVVAFANATGVPNEGKRVVLMSSGLTTMPDNFLDKLGNGHGPQGDRLQSTSCTVEDEKLASIRKHRLGTRTFLKDIRT